MIVNFPRVIYLRTLLAVSCWCALILLAPLLVSFEGPLRAVGNGLYFFFGQICHQLDDRSLHLAGHPLAVCSRCSGIYFGFLLGMIFYPLVLGYIPPVISARSILIAGFAPMLLDVAAGGLGIYEPANFLRVATGGWFGMASSMVVLPSLIEAGALILRDFASYRRFQRGSPSV
jgi:uncharacterized membrane protein